MEYTKGTVMELKIGTSIRRLRKEKNITQEELASAIGVSAQAVSKWERNEGYPDITLLPDISAFFGVSLDTLCGIDDEQNRLMIGEIITRSRTADSYEERVRIAREGVRQFPFSCELKSALADALTGCPGRWTPPQETLLEIISLYEEILKHSTSQHLRNSVIYNLSKIYDLAGEHDKAVKSAANLPSVYESSEHALAQVLHGDELVDHIQNSIIQILPLIDSMIRIVLDTDWYSPEEKIKLCEKMIAMYDTVSECHDWPFGMICSIMMYQRIADYCIDLCDYSGSINALNSAADLAVCSDSLVFEGKPDSLLLNLIEFDALSGPQNDRNELLCDIESDNKLDPIRGFDEYKLIIRKLTE